MSKLMVARIVIKRFVTDDDLVDKVTAEDGNGEPVDLTTALGMLRLAEDTLIRERMGEGE